MVAIEVVSLLCVGQSGETSPVAAAHVAQSWDHLLQQSRSAGPYPQTGCRGSAQPMRSPDEPATLRIMHELKIGEILRKTTSFRKLERFHSTSSV